MGSRFKKNSREVIRRVDSAKLVEVIEVIYFEGSGTEADPNRCIKEYRTKEGVIIAKKEPMNDSSFCPCCSYYLGDMLNSLPQSIE